MADSCLSHRNIFVQRGEPAQKAANARTRPEGVVREFQRERLVLNRTANLRRSDREGLPLTAAKVELSMTDLVRQAITLAVLNCAAR